MTEQSREMLQIARRYAGLPADKRAAFRARLIEAGIAPERLPIVPLADRPRRLPLSPAQERLWFLWRLSPDDTAYVIAGAVRLAGRLDVARLRRALSGIVARHEALRTRFGEADGKAWQIVADTADYGWSEDGDLTVRPFDLEQGPLLRAALAVVGPDRHDLLLSLHHIVADGWSIPILLQELSALYAGADLAPLPIQYGDYALWQREWLDERRQGEQLAYWRDRLGTEHPELPLPVKPGPSGGPGARLTVMVPAPLTARLRRLARDEGATLFMTLLAGFAVLLHRHAGQRDIRIGVPSAGRQRVETEGLIGFFVNTLVLRAELSGAQSFADLLAQLRQRLLEAQANQDLPFERLAAELNPHRGNPLFRVMFNLQQVGTTTLDLAGLTVTRIELPPGTPQVDLALAVTETPDDLAIAFDYAADLFETKTVERLSGDYVDLLGQLAGASPLHAFNLASAVPEDAPATYAFDAVPQRFSRQAASRPLAEAVVCGDERLSYGALEGWSNRIGRRLRRLGVGAEERVGLCVERSAGLAAGLLGILKAGGAYVPLDPAYPEARLAEMIGDAGVRRVVVDATTAARFPDLELVRIDVVEAESAAGWCEDIDPDQLAYVIYTSGSTGRPKGVAISHGALSLHMNDFIGTYAVTADDVVLQLATISFDVGSEQLLPPLLTGARVVMRGPELLEPAVLNRILAAERVSVAGFATAYWQQWLHDLPDQLPALRLVMVGGEALPGDALRRWQAGPLAGVRLDNLYGPTETTVTSCLYQTGTDDADSLFVAIGHGFPGRSVAVVDTDGNLAPMGELCIGGDSVGRGYLDRPGLTAERFVPDPWRPGGRLYRTGDLCRRRADGTIEFLGRLDAQVKLRGYRIELGEVEAALRACDGVKASSAAIKGEGENRRLVGYAVGDDLDADALKAALAAKLPDYLVPSVVVLLDALPLMPNGKTNAAALPEPAATERELVAPRDEREAALLSVWRGVLKRDDIGVTENFFALGGDSILSLQVVARARQAGLKLTPKQLFEEPTIATLAAMASAVVETAAAIVDFAAPSAAALGVDPAEVEDIYPATALQQGLIYHSLLAAGDGVYVNQLRLTLRAPLDIPALRAAWDEALARHAVLRTGFDWRQGDVTLQVVRRRLDLPWIDHDWSGRDAYEADLAAWRDTDVAAGFDLGAPPLFRLALFRRPDGDVDLVWTNHHALTDGWSGAQLLGEVNEAYRARRAGRSPALPAPAAYRAYVGWLRAQPSGEAWWRRHFAAITDPIGLGASLGPPGVTEPGSHRLSRRLDGLGHRLRAAAQRRAVTLNTLVQGAWALLIARYGGRPEVAFGVTVSGRPAELPGIERMLGLFINSLPLWVALQPARRLADWLQDLQRHNVELRQQEHGGLSDLQRWSGRTGDALFDSLVVFENYPVDEALHRAPGGLDVAAIASWDRTHFPLTLTVVPRATLELVWEWDGARFARPAIEQIAADYLDLLHQLAAAGDVRLGQIGLTSGVHDPSTGSYDFDPVPLRVSRRAALQPAAEAVSCEAERLSYGALEGWSNRIGRRLRRYGVGPEARVGLCIERSAGLVAGLLGIWKSGGAYVPLDPSYPAARLAEMIGDAGVRRVVTDRGTAAVLQDVLAGLDLVVIEDVDEDDSGWVQPYLPGQLAYVIYTSGSTGKPKGVAISHGALSLHMDDFIGTYGIAAEDVVLQSSTVNFDVALHETFPALIRGGRVVMRGPALWELDSLTQRLADERVTFARIPTAYWQQWLHVLPARLPALRQVTVGGEGLPGDALRRWQSGPLAHVRLDNLYGPTETTVAALYRRTTAADADAVIVPIGVAYPSRGIAVIDGDGNLVPVGGLGELCIGGETVGRGYLDRPGLTADRFVPDPWRPGGRLYRTGDLCRRQADGTIEFLGRLDAQVKLRGYRIELGEVEAALRACDGVKASAAAIKGEGENRRLVGYAVGDDLDADALKAALAAKLPDYLVPSVVVLLDALPLMPNGKTNAAALPEPAATERDLVAPRDEREAALLSVWRGVLKRDDIGVTENFFALGGDSILSLQVVARARQAGLKLTPKQLFEEPTIAALAAMAGDVKADIVEDVAGDIPLTPIQSWFFDRHPEGENHWNQAVLLKLREELDLGRLRTVLNQLVVRHDALRLRFDRRGDGWHQTVSASSLVEIEVADVEDLAEAGTALQRRLDITHGPLLRAGYYRLPDGERRLLLTVHHLAVDGVSWRVLLEELQEAYAGSELPQPSTSWASWARRLHVYGRTVDELGWWRERLSQAKNLGLKDGDRKLSSSKLLTFRLDEAATAKLLAAAPRAYRLGVDELLLAALVQAAGQGLLVEVEGHGREDLFDDVDLSRTVGWFTTSYPVWLADGSPVAVKEALRSVPMKGLHWGLLRARDLPVPDIGFNYLGRFDQSVERDGLFSFARESGGRSLSGSSALDHALEINGSIANGCLSLSWRYSPDVIEPSVVEGMLGRFGDKLNVLVAHCLTATPRPTASDYPLATLTQEQFDALDLGEVQDIYPATGLQQGLLYHGLLKQGDGVYVNQLRLTLKGPVDTAALKAAWNDVVARHDILRTGFEWRHGGEALQVVRPSVELPWVELDDVDLAAWCKADLARGFDLSQAPLLRLALFRRSDGDYDLIRTSHHLLSDGWSSARLLAEVSECYKARVAGRPVDLPPAVPYRSYVAWTRRQPSSEAWWRGQAASVEDPVGLTGSFGVPAKAEAGIHRIEQHLPALGERLRIAARRRSVTLNTLMQGAWALLLSRFGSKGAVGFGVTVSGRPASLPGVERMLGLFINSLPLWVGVPASRNLNGWLQDLQRRNVELRQYEHTPLSDLQRWTGRSGDALFDSLLVFENYPVDEAVGRGEGALRAGKVEIAERTHYPLTLTISPAPALALDWAWDGERLDRGDVEGLTGHYLGLLEQLAGEGDPALGAIGLAAPAAIAEPLDYVFQPVHRRLSPTAVVACEGEAIDGAELAAWSRRIASQLRRLGVAPDELVGLCVERSVGLVAAMLGVWQAGGAYVPLDPAYPAARLADMIADAGLRRVVVDRGTAGRLAGLLDGLDLVFIDEGDDEEWFEPVHPDRLAYVIYTSGSTGRPKGVGVSHGALDRMLMSMAVRPGLTASDVWLAVTSLSFDIAALELLLPLIAGARLEIARRDSVQDGARLAALLEATRATVLQATPLGWRLLLEGGWAGRLLTGLCGGEALPPDLAASLHARGVTLWNMYGPTETTIWSAVSLTEANRPIDLGQPIHDTILRLIDESGHVVPLGGIGELCIGGANLARGYLGRPGLTAERFVPDPLGQGARLYRTGDLCRQRADGRLEFLGRLDQQVKLRGYRIELGEVEAVLRTCPGVKAAAAVVKGEGENRRLVGYAVGDNLDLDALKAVLAARLPDYLVPSAVLVLDALPQTPNGKLDRRALPEPEAAARRVIAPRNPVEQALRDIWAQVLRRDDIGVTDSFFELGGDSLGALRVAGRIRQALNRDLPLQTLFAHPRLADLAVALADGRAAAATAILPRPTGVRVPLSLAQERLWFLWRLAPDDTAYVLAGAVRLTGRLDIPRLRRALAGVVARHEALRTRFVEEDGTAWQVVSPEPDYDWSENGGSTVRAFDLAQGPLLRAVLATTGPDAHELLLSMHHIVSDGWSIAILLREMSALYAGADLPPLPIQYGDYALWQREWLDPARQVEQLTYWRDRLGMEHPDLPLPARTGRSTGQGGRLTARVPADLTARLRLLSRDAGATLFMTMLGGFVVLLHRYSGQHDIRIGVPSAGRQRAETEGLIGFFVNTLVLRAEISGMQAFSDLVAQLRQRLLEAQENQDLPFERLVAELNPDRGNPLFRAMFNLQQAERGVLDLPGLVVTGLDLASGAAQVDLALNVTELADELGLGFDYASDLFAAETITRLADDYIDLLNRLAPALPVASLALASGIADPSTASHGFDALPLRVSRRAALQPAAEAVSCEAERLSYGALEGWSNRIGRRLRRYGVGPEARVGLCIERSAGLVAGLLGIWKSGGAYVPLDPSYPAARLAEMIGDAGVRRVVTDRGTAAVLQDVLAGLDLVVIEDVDEDDSGWVQPYLPGQLAYVIYTSGSTGKPKGVAISHGALSLHIDDFIGTYGIAAEDVVLQSSTVNFDVALHETFPALIRGGRVVMRGPALWELDSLTRRLADERVTFARIPTAYWQQWLHVLPARLPALRQVTVGGEGLPGDALRRWQSGPLAHVRLDNLYGPTETTVAALYRRTAAADADAVIVPIGVAYPSRSLAVIDGDGNLVPVGGLGELCIGGETVGRGYLDRPGLTADRFVPDPWRPGGRLYRTGDLCRRQADGTIEFLGRLDAQVKLRGYRIELGEVEAALRACDGVKASAAAIKGEGENRRLVGYAVGDDLDADALKAALAAKLPDYLVPSVVVLLDALPLMPNGKTNAAALPEPAATERDLVAPRDEREAALLSVWRGVLKRDDIGVTENFFALGGDSILSLQVVARARQAGLKLTPKQLFEEPTIAALAAMAGDVKADIVEDVAGDIPLTPIQSWFFDRHPEGENHWNQAVLLKLREELDLGRLRTVLNQLVVRHDALRLRFDRRGDGWHQTVSASSLVEIEVADVEDLAEAGTALQRRLDITHGPLLRAGYYRLPDGERRLLLTVHHLAVDGVSWRVLLEELQEAYAGSELPPPSTSWASWARRLHVYGRTVDELGWWRERLSQAKNLGLKDGDRKLSSSKLLTFRLDEAATAKLLAAAPRAYRLGVDELLLAALVQAAGQGLLVEVEGHGREDLFDDVDLSRTVGWFTTSYPVWLADGSPVAVKEALRSVPMKGLHWGLLRARDLPVPDIGFNYLGRFDQSVERDGLFSFARESGGRSLSGSSALDHALEINGSIANGCLSLSWRYSPDVIEPSVVEGMLGRFGDKLNVLVAHCLTATPRPTASDYPLATLTQEQFDALDLGEVQDIYPATGLQQGLLYHGLLKQGDGVYVNQLRLTLKGPVDTAALKAAWNDVVARHDILRTGFEWRHGGEALQVVRPSVELPWVELDDVDLAAWCKADLARGFDLSQAPLLRLALFRRSDGDYDLIRTSHHLLSDGWSSARLLAEVSECYKARVAGRPVDLPPAVPYRSYVAWTRRQPSSEAWWRGQAASVEDPVGLTGSFGSPSQPEPGIHRLEQHLPALGERLRIAARRRSVTLNTLMQGAWALLLSRFGSKGAVGFGVTVSGRPASLPGVERMLGLFINSLPLWVGVPASRNLNGWLQDLQRRNVELRQYEHTPLSDLQRWTGRSGDALFDSLLVFENYPVDEAVGRGEGALRAGKVEIAERTHYPLTLTISPAPALALDWAWDGERLDRGDVEGLTGHYLGLLEQLAGEGDPALGAIGLAAPAAIAEPLDYVFQPVHRRLSPTAVVACEGEAIDGAELAAWSRRIASQLRRLGVAPDELVGLCVERSVGLVAAMLGVWQAGGAYVPLDPAYPAARLADMIADAGLRRVVVDRGTAGRLAGLLDGLDLVFIDEGDDEEWFEPVHPDRLAYVIYTSGSTGRPKGVGVSHGALDRMLMSMAVRPGLTASDVWLAVTSLSFDIAALELLLPLIAGARLEIARRDSVQDGARLAALLEATRATVLQATPLGWRLLLEGGWAGRLLTGLCGGEALPPDLAASLHARGVTLWNMYGPTETTIWSAVSLTEANRPIDLGQPIHDTILRLIDESGHVVPLGGIGELCIGGANLARGYLGRPGLTAERFVPDPLGQGARLYRTGDLCRQRADGRLEFLGRLDQQVKLRGYRIEPGEVEAVLRTCPGVKAAAAVVKGEGDGRRLVGYAVGDNLDPDALKAVLAARLPDYLVPSVVLVLDALPQTPNGKLDRRALPEPEAAAKPVIAPRNPVEQALRDIWAQVLRRDDIGVTDSFFELGGDSLGALRVSALAIRRGLGNLTPATVFARPVLAALASYLQVEAAGLPANILPMNSVGMGHALFCLHPGYGLVGEYRALADALEGQVTVYGVQSPIHAEPEWRAADFDALAANYVRRVRQVQPEGPYFLLGWSHGGLVAAAMARRLEAEGQRLGLVGLIDVVARIDRNVVQPAEAGDENAEIAALVAGIRGGGWQAHAFDAQENEALRRTVAVVRHHHALVQGYALPRLASDLSLWWAGQAGLRTPAELDWQVHTSGKVRVIGTLDTGHAAIVSDSRLIADVAQLMRERQDENISPAS